MNTTKKGDILEDKVFKIFKELLENDEFYVNRKTSQIFQKKGYYSEKRKSKIIFDVSIESYLPNSKEYSHLIIFECKNLNKNVSVDDIEEFGSKLSQVGEHNTKGFIVSKKGFSKSLINIAKAEKIGLIRVQSNNELEWVNYRKERYKNKIDFFDNNNEPLSAFLNGKTFNNIADLLLELNAIDLYKHYDKFITVPYLTNEQINNIVSRLLKHDTHNNYCVDLNKLTSFLAEKYEMKFEFLSLNNYTLGKIEFEPLKISIEKKLTENRLRFTLCHEIGHLVLHKKILEQRIDLREDNENLFYFDNSTIDYNSKRLEIQANIFAKLLLMPETPFVETVIKFFRENNINKNHLYLDSQPVNKLLVDKLLTKLSLKFKVSKEAAKIRLIEMNLLKEESNSNIYNTIKRLRR